MAESKKYVKIPIEDYRRMTTLLKEVQKEYAYKAKTINRFNPDIAPTRYELQHNKIGKVLDEVSIHTEIIDE